MSANLSSVLTWVSTEVVEAPEPLVLLVLGGLFLLLSFRVRSRRSAASVAVPPPARSTPTLASPRPLPPGATAWAGQEAR